jgi:hypothetical protein
METLQTHCYATGTVTLLWKRPQRPNMSQYLKLINDSRIHANVEMASEVGYDGLDGDHDGHPALGQKQPTTRPIIKKNGQIMMTVPRKYLK